MCETGKRTYRTKRKAIVTLDRIRATRAKDAKYRNRAEAHAYHCQICGLWHLTSQEQRTAA